MVLKTALTVKWTQRSVPSNRRDTKLVLFIYCKPFLRLAPRATAPGIFEPLLSLSFNFPLFRRGIRRLGDFWGLRMIRVRCSEAGRGVNDSFGDTALGQSLGLGIKLVFIVNIASPLQHLALFLLRG